MTIPAATIEELRLLPAFKQVTCLNIVDLELSACDIFLECLGSISTTLKSLSLQDVDVLFDAEQLTLNSPRRLTMSKLEDICADTTAFHLVECLAGSFEMPALHSVSLDISLEPAPIPHAANHQQLQDGHTGDTHPPPQATTVWRETQLSKLKTLVQLDAILPSRCRNRIYEVNLEGDMRNIHIFLLALAPLARRDVLKIHLSITSLEFSSAMQDPSSSTLPRHLGFHDAIAAFPSEGHAAVASLQIAPEDVYSEGASQAAEVIELPNLISLELIMNITPVPGYGKATDSLLEKLQVPRLKTLLMDPGRDDACQDLHTLKERLPTWPLLGNVTFRSSAPFQGLTEQLEYHAFLGACKEQGIIVAHYSFAELAIL